MYLVGYGNSVQGGAQIGNELFCSLRLPRRAAPTACGLVSGVSGGTTKIQFRVGLKFVMIRFVVPP